MIILPRTYATVPRKVLFSLAFQATDAASSLVPLLVCIWDLLHSQCHVAISDNLHCWSLSGSFDHTDTAPWYSKPVHFPSNG